MTPHSSWAPEGFPSFLPYWRPYIKYRCHFVTTHGISNKHIRYPYLAFGTKKLLRVEKIIAASFHPGCKPLGEGRVYSTLSSTSLEIVGL